MASDQLFFPLVMAAFVAATFASTGLHRWLAGRRARAIEALAAARGWEYQRADDADVVTDSRFPLFQEGHTHKVDDEVLAKVDGLRLRAFQYRYTTGSGKNQRTFVYRVLLAPMPRPSPGLGIREERLGLKLWEAMGGRDIDFESDAFSRRFFVQCPDRRFAYDAITPRMMEFLLSTPRGWTWQWRGQALAIYSVGPLHAEDCDTLVGLGRGFIAQLSDGHASHTGATMDVAPTLALKPPARYRPGVWQRMPALHLGGFALLFGVVAFLIAAGIPFERLWGSFAGDPRTWVYLTVGVGVAIGGLVRLHRGNII
jgi:hypothetical protein